MFIYIMLLFRHGTNKSRTKNPIFQGMQFRNKGGTEVCKGRAKEWMCTKLGYSRELALHLISFREFRYEWTHLRLIGVYNKNTFFKQQLAVEASSEKQHEITHCCINGTWKEWRQNLRGSIGKGLAPSHILGTKSTGKKSYTLQDLQRKTTLQLP